MFFFNKINFHCRKIFYFLLDLFISKNIQIIKKKVYNSNKNLVIGAIYGYSLNDIEFFLKSLRKYYNEDIVLILSGKDYIKLKNNLENYNCHFAIDNRSPLNGFINRYFVYKKILSSFKEKKLVLLTDTRDVFFQNNPFYKVNKNKIYIGCEYKNYKECKINKKWLINFYNHLEYKKLKNHKILCSGVMLGNTNLLLKIIKYLMIEHKKIIKKNKFSITFPRGMDNTSVNIVVRKLLLTNKNIYLCENKKNSFIGTYATTPLKSIIIKNKNIVNVKSKKINIIHQYDRHPSLFRLLKLNS
jgi:hypothetical protein